MSSGHEASLIAPSRPEHRAVLQGRRREIEDALRQVMPAGTRQVVWEVGCGHGHFLEAYAKAHPARVCVGIDIESDRIARARRKRDRSQLQNLHFLRAEARLFLETLPPEITFSTVFVLFPDPWPKLRHHKHRLMQPDFLRALARKMAPNGRLYFRTDALDYHAAAERVLLEDKAWRLVEGAWPFEHETVFQSRATDYRSLVAEALPTVAS